MRQHFLSAAGCPPPAAPSGATFPTDDDLLAYGACQGSLAFASTSVYADIEAGIEAGVAAGAVVAGIVGEAAYALTFIGADTLASAVSVAAAAAVPVLGWAVGIAVGVYTVLNSLGLSSCNIDVPRQGGGTELIECSWYPQFVQNAMQWVSVNTATALTMSAEELSTTHSIFASTSDPLYRIDGALPATQQYIQGLPTASDILRQLQLPAAAALIAAAPGLLNEVTGTISSTGQVPIQVQFPALTNNDVLALHDKFSLNYQTVVDSATTFALTKSNQPINASTFPAQLGISKTDAVAIIQSHNIPYTGTLTGPIGVITPIGGGDHPGLPITGGISPVSLARPTSLGTKVVVGASLVGIGLVLYHVFVSGYTFLSTGKAIVRGTEKAYEKSKDWIEKRFHRSRKRNPIRRFSATGGREVAHRVNLDDSRYRIALTKSGAMLLRNERLVATFKASKFQKTKIRAGTGEVLIFTDQVIS